MTPSLRIHIGSARELAAEFARQVVALATTSLAERGLFALAVPGGSAAEVLLPALARESLPWARIHVFWCDERDVPPDDAASNAGLLRRLWLGTPAWREARFHPMPGGAADLGAAADAYERELRSTLGANATFDLVLLGVGEDGHVASLFGADASQLQLERMVLAIAEAPKPPPRRLSLSFPVLARSRAVVVAAFGSAKAIAVRDAVEGEQAETPLARLVRSASAVTLLLDESAASLLRVRRSTMPP